MTDPIEDRGPLAARAARDSEDAETPVGSAVSFRARLTMGLIAAAVLPLAGFGSVLLANEARSGADGGALARVLLFAVAVAALLGVLLALWLVTDLTRPLRAIAAAVDRVSSGDLSTRIEVAGEDELARLAESHNRLAADLERRNRELGRILAAIGATSLGAGVEALVAAGGRDARQAFGMIDADILLVDPREIAFEDNVPGEPRPVRALLRVGAETLGVLVGRLPATRSWEPADQDLLELFAAEVAVAIRNAQLFTRVEAQNARLLELDAAKDDFLRGISHNLQTPLTSIRAYADQMALANPDRRLAIITEQSDRLSRMVRQLLTVSRLESGALRPRLEIVALATRVRRAWEALGAHDVTLDVRDEAGGWLAIADPDQLDQVLWALLDNAVKYGSGSTVTATIRPDEAGDRLNLTIADRGTGVPDELRTGLFERYTRGVAADHPEGTGIGLYVSRELCHAMGGSLELEPAGAEPGATFTITLPAEPSAAGES